MSKGKAEEDDRHYELFFLAYDADLLHFLKSGRRTSKSRIGGGCEGIILTPRNQEHAT